MLGGEAGFGAVRDDGLLSGLAGGDDDPDDPDDPDDAPDMSMPGMSFMSCIECWAQVVVWLANSRAALAAKQAVL